MSNEANQPTPVKTVLLKVGGKPFKCECGSNCFHKTGPHSIYGCNTCGAEYAGESAGR